MFNNFVSLGWFCGTAASMERYGLRRCSGPFDWYFSEFKGVIDIIDHDFSDFLSRDNLSEEPGIHGAIFNDVKYGFSYIHDIENSLDADYESIHSRYMHKIDTFRECIKNSTCFIRAVRDPGEVSYIIENKEHIDRILKRHNPDNEIIYLLPGFLDKASFHASYYTLDIDRYLGDTETDLVSLFDTNSKFISFCIDNYDQLSRSHNREFYLEKKLKKADEKINKLNSRYETLTKMDFKDFSTVSLPDKVIIYGAGNIGKLFYRRIKDRCSVLCFIDQHSSEELYDGIPVYRISMCENIDIQAVVIVTAVSDYKTIRTELLKPERNKQRMVISLDDIL